MLGESLRVPFRADDWIGTILVGSMLTLLAGLLVAIWVIVTLASTSVGAALVVVVAIPSLVVRGYLLGVVRSGIRGDSAVESFIRWGSLLRDGVRSAVISAVYLLPAAVFCGLALGGAIATAVSPDGFEGALQAVTAAVILFGGFGLLLYGLVYLYVRPAARAVFASTGSVRAALRVRRVLRLSVTPDYITGWLIGMGILIVGPTLLLPVAAVSLLLGFVSPGIAFVGLLSTVLFGICLTFACRVSAAWAVGRGRSGGLEQLFPTAFRQPTDGVIAQPSLSVDEENRSEAPVTVQTGRPVEIDSQSGVSDDHGEPVVAEAVDGPTGLRRLATGEVSGVPIRPQRHNLESQASEPQDAELQPDEISDQQPDEVDEPQTDEVDEPQTDEVDESQPDEVDEPQTEDGFIWGPENHE